MIYLFKFGFSENFLIFLTGCLIFYPICFVQNPVHAIIMGVTMHYTQYLYFTYKVCDLRNHVDKNDKKQIGDYLFKSGEKCNSIFFLQTGEVEIFLEDL